MKILMLSLLLFPSLSKSSEPLCMAEIIYSESRGESVEGAIAVGSSVMNRSKRLGKAICKLTGVTAKKIPELLRPHYLALAKAVMVSKSTVKDADSWNTGKESKSKGEITRHIGRHVFYRMAEL